MVERLVPPAASAPPENTVGTLTPQVLERPLRPGEDSLDDLERAFRATAVEAPAAKGAKAAPSEPAKDDDGGKTPNQSIRVAVDTLEHLMTMVSELVLTRNQLLEIVRRQKDCEFRAPLQRLSNVTAELQEGVMKTRMQPIGNAWSKLPRIVRDLSNELGKKIDLEMQGAETELDRQVLELIKDPLTHMVRNSADHGLEMPAQRRAAGKPAARAPSGCRPITKAAKSSSDRRRRPRARYRPHQGEGGGTGLVVRSRRRETDRGANPQIHIRARLLHRRQSDQRFRPRRRHGRGTQQYRSDRRHHRCEVGRRRRTRASPSRSRSRSRSSRP